MSGIAELKSLVLGMSNKRGIELFETSFASKRRFNKKIANVEDIENLHPLIVDFD